jgi:AAA domain
MATQLPLDPLVIIDPIMSLMGKADTNKDNEVRAVLTPLKTIAEKHDIAIIMIRHLTKSRGDNMQHWGGGSVAFGALARIGLIAVKDPDDEDQYVFGPVKSNLSEKKGLKLLYSVTNDKEQGDERPYIVWNGLSMHTDQELTGRPIEPTGQGRKDILSFLKEHAGEQFSPAQIAAELGSEKVASLTVTLNRMYDAGQIDKPVRGMYSFPTATK